MTGTVTLVAPMAGWLLPLSRVPDEAFATGMVGEGIAIEPLDDMLRAPCDGMVVAVAPTRHAVTLRLGNGAELLLHVGLDTVKLNGDGFVTHVVEGDRVGAGDPLIGFDMDGLATRVRSLVTPLVVVNEGFAVAAQMPGRRVAAGDPIAGISTVATAATATAAARGPDVRQALVVPLPNGIHARPAAKLVGLAKSFTCDLVIEKGSQWASLRSPVGLMMLGVGAGDRIEIAGTGPDAAAAVAAVAELLASGMGEAPATPSATPPNRGDGRTIGGVCAAPGLAVGPARHLQRRAFDVPERGEGVEVERRKLHRALEAAAHRLAAPGGAHRAIAEAHRAMLDDPDLIKTADAAITAGASAAAAWRRATRSAADRLRTSGNALLAERAADLLDLENQLLAELLGMPPAPRLELGDDTILLADELLPSEFAALDKAKLAGLCTAKGGATSHVAILAASAGIPMIVAAGERVLAVRDGAMLRLDADAALVEPLTDKAAVEAARRAVAEWRSSAQVELAAAQTLAATADGTRIEVFANLGSADDAVRAVALGAEGCGLLRTEFLFLDRAVAPSVDEQAAIYQSIADALGGRPLILRTLDIGGDKPVPYLPSAGEENPALGLRGIRLSLANRDLLADQLEAALRVRGGCRIMLPMVSDVDELRQVRALLGELRGRAGHVAPVELGVMIETPAAALLAEALAKEADFLSIGTNDLTQYVLVMDRGNAALAGRIDGLHPAVLGLVKRTVDGARRHGRWVGVCGGLAADPAATAILVGLGVDELSVAPAAVPALKARIRALRTADCRRLAARALTLASAQDVRQLVAASSPHALLESA